MERSQWRGQGHRPFHTFPKSQLWPLRASVEKHRLHTPAPVPDTASEGARDPLSSLSWHSGRCLQLQKLFLMSSFSQTVELDHPAFTWPALNSDQDLPQLLPTTSPCERTYRVLMRHYQLHVFQMVTCRIFLSCFLQTCTESVLLNTTWGWTEINSWGNGTNIRYRRQWGHLAGVSRKVWKFSFVIPNMSGSTRSILYLWFNLILTTTTRGGVTSSASQRRLRACAALSSRPQAAPLQSPARSSTLGSSTAPLSHTLHDKSLSALLGLVLLFSIEP